MTDTIQLISQLKEITTSISSSITPYALGGARLLAISNFAQDMILFFLCICGGVMCASLLYYRNALLEILNEDFLFFLTFSLGALATISLIAWIILIPTTIVYFIGINHADLYLSYEILNKITSS